jgi:hypothetical protein
MKKMKLFPHEIFEKLQEVRAMKDRVQILEDNASFALKTILQANFNDWVKFELPEGSPPYTKDENPPEHSAGRLEKVIPQLKLFVEGSKLPSYKKEGRFVQLLESIHHKDAEILIAMKDKSLMKLYSAITPALVKKAFPLLIRDTASKK